MLAEGGEPVSADPSDIPTPAELSAGCCSRMCFCYLNPMLRKGSREPLTFKDIFPLPAVHAAEQVHQLFDAEWREQLTTRGDEEASILSAVFVSAGWRFWAAGFLLL